MKKLLITLVLMMGIMTIKAADPVKQWGQLQVKGAQLSDQKGNPIVLRGVSLGWHNLWPRFYNKKAIKWLKQDWHPTVVRAAMGVMIEDNYLENRDFALECVEKVVNAAIKQDIYVIVDWHSHKMYTEEAVKFFDYISKKYGKHPNIIYEIFTEPVFEPSVKPSSSCTVRSREAPPMVYAA